jgi:hypothetical protein
MPLPFGFTLAMQHLVYNQVIACHGPSGFVTLVWTFVSLQTNASVASDRF